MPRPHGGGGPGGFQPPKNMGKTIGKLMAYVGRSKWLLVLVAIPLPGTGAWTGALVACVMDLRLKSALPAIFSGVLIAGAIVSAITMGIVSL